MLENGQGYVPPEAQASRRKKSKEIAKRELASVSDEEIESALGALESPEPTPEQSEPLEIIAELPEEAPPRPVTASADTAGTRNLTAARETLDVSYQASQQETEKPAPYETPATEPSAEQKAAVAKLLKKSAEDLPKWREVYEKMEQAQTEAIARVDKLQGLERRKAILETVGRAEAITWEETFEPRVKLPPDSPERKHLNDLETQFTQLIVRARYEVHGGEKPAGLIDRFKAFVTRKDERRESSANALQRRLLGKNLSLDESLTAERYSGTVEKIFQTYKELKSYEDGLVHRLQELPSSEGAEIGKATEGDETGTRNLTAEYRAGASATDETNESPPRPPAHQKKKGIRGFFQGLLGR